MRAAGVSCHITQRGEITAKLPPLAMRMRCVPSASGWNGGSVRPRRIGTMFCNAEELQSVSG